MLSPMTEFSDLLNLLVTFITLIKNVGARPSQRACSLYLAITPKFRSTHGDIFPLTNN